MRNPQGAPEDIPEECWAVIEQYRAELLQQARMILGNLEDAEDVVQETFYEAVRHREKLSNARSLSAWLKAINRCNAISRVRGRKHDSVRLQVRRSLEAEHTFTTGGFSILELRESLNKAMEDLPAHLQQIVKLRYYENLSYKDIADRLSMPIGNVGGLLMDAGARMYARLKKQLETTQNNAVRNAPIVSSAAENTETQHVNRIDA